MSPVSTIYTLASKYMYVTRTLSANFEFSALMLRAGQQEGHLARFKTHFNGGECKWMGYTLKYHVGRKRSGRSCEDAEDKDQEGSWLIQVDQESHP